MHEGMTRVPLLIGFWTGVRSRNASPLAGGVALSLGPSAQEIADSTPLSGAVSRERGAFVGLEHAAMRIERPTSLSRSIDRGAPRLP